MTSASTSPRDLAQSRFVSLDDAFDGEQTPVFREHEQKVARKPCDANRFQDGGEPMLLLPAGKHRAPDETAQIGAVAQQTQKVVERMLDAFHGIALAGELEQRASVTLRHCRIHGRR